MMSSALMLLSPASLPLPSPSPSLSPSPSPSPSPSESPPPSYILQATEPTMCYGVNHMWSMVSKKLRYSKRYNDAMPSDIVTVPAGDVAHPAVKCGLVNRNYLLFGVVIYFIYINWETGRDDE